MKVQYKIATCVVGLVAFATLGHAAIDGVDLTVIDKTSFRPIVVHASSVDAVTLTRSALQVKSVDIAFHVAGQASLRRLSLVSRSQSLLRAKYDAIQGAIEHRRHVTIAAAAVRAFGQYLSNIDLAPLVVVIGPPIPTPTPTPTPMPTPTPTPTSTPTPTPIPTPTPTPTPVPTPSATPTPTPTPMPTPTPTPDRVVLDELKGDFSVDALKVYDTTMPGQPALDGTISTVALVQQSGALQVEVGFALSDSSTHQLTITGSAADAVRANYGAIGDALGSGQSFWLSVTATPDSGDTSAYRVALESGQVQVDVLPSRTGAGTLPAVALTVSPGADPLVIAAGVQSIGTQSIGGTVTLRVSFFIPGDSNHHWLTLQGAQDAVFTEFSSIVHSINSRWNFGLYAYSAASTDSGFSYVGALGTDVLILSLQPLGGSALPGMSASAVVDGTVTLSGMPVRAVYFYYDTASGPYFSVQGTDSSGNQGGLMIMHATTALYDNIVSGLSASDAMSTTFAGYGTPHPTAPNQFITDLSVNTLYFTAGFTPPAPTRMSITASYVGSTPVTSSQVNGINVHFSAGAAVSDSYFISSADGTQRPLTLTGATNSAVEAVFDRVTRAIAGGKNVSIQALNAAPGTSNDFVLDVASPSFVLTVN